MEHHHGAREPYVFDSEWAAFDGLPAWDAAYFTLQSGLILSGWNPDQLMRRLSEVAAHPPETYRAHEYRALLVLVLTEVAALGPPGARHRESAIVVLTRLGEGSWLAVGNSGIAS